MILELFGKLSKNAIDGKKRKKVQNNTNAHSSDLLRYGQFHRKFPHVVTVL